LYWDNAWGGSFTLLKSSVGTTTEFSTAGTVTASALLDGLTYRFKVVAVNAIGQSILSDSVSIYAADVPDAPNAPTLVS
jgi:hypothetical protein